MSCNFFKFLLSERLLLQTIMRRTEKEGNNIFGKNINKQRISGLTTQKENILNTFLQCFRFELKLNDQFKNELNVQLWVVSFAQIMTHLSIFTKNILDDCVKILLSDLYHGLYLLQKELSILTQTTKL